MNKSDEVIGNNQTKEFDLDNKALTITTYAVQTPNHDDNDDFEKFKIQTQSQNFYDDYFS